MNGNILKKKNTTRLKRKTRIRSRIIGNSLKPRVSIFKSNRYLFAQAIDDINGNTLLALSSKTLNLGKSKESASLLGVEFSKLLKKKNITNIVFDRNAYIYHGVIASFADALRGNEIKF